MNPNHILSVEGAVLRLGGRELGSHTYSRARDHWIVGERALCAAINASRRAQGLPEIVFTDGGSVAEYAFTGDGPTGALLLGGLPVAQFAPTACAQRHPVAEALLIFAMNRVRRAQNRPEFAIGYE